MKLRFSDHAPEVIHVDNLIQPMLPGPFCSSILTTFDSYDLIITYENEKTMSFGNLKEDDTILHLRFRMISKEDITGLSLILLFDLLDVMGSEYSR